MVGVNPSESDDWSRCALSGSLGFDAVVSVDAEVEAYRNVKHAVGDFLDDEICVRTAYNG